jgi:hypothetical protein
LWHGDKLIQGTNRLSPLAQPYLHIKIGVESRVREIEGEVEGGRNGRRHDIKI